MTFSQLPVPEFRIFHEMIKIENPENLHGFPVSDPRIANIYQLPIPKSRISPKMLQMENPK